MPATIVGSFLGADKATRVGRLLSMGSYRSGVGVIGRRLDAGENLPSRAFSGA
jgi:hypothetical protein